jgi:hypothetical protein
MQDTSVQPANAENQNNQKFLNVKNYHKSDRRLHRGGKAAFKAGDVIPYRLPVKPSGSRFDVKAESRHADSRWTVMLHRKFNTGQEDDVVFDPRKRFSFAIAVFDDTGGDHSKATRSLVLVFQR